MKYLNFNGHKSFHWVVAFLCVLVEYISTTFVSVVKSIQKLYFSKSLKATYFNQSGDSFWASDVHTNTPLVPGSQP